MFWKKIKNQIKEIKKTFKTVIILVRWHANRVLGKSTFPRYVSENCIDTKTCNLESMEEYIESYCWIQNTYWVPMYQNIPDDVTARESKIIFFAFEGICFSFMI